MTLIFVAFVACTSGERSGCPAAVRASVRIQSSDAVGVDDADLESTVVGARVLEHLDTAEEPTDVADENAGRVADVPGVAVDLDLRLERLRAKVLRAGPDIGGPSEAILERAVGLLDHRSVEAGAGHDGEVLALELADVELAPFPVQPDRNRALDVLRDAEVRREKVGGAGRQDRERVSVPASRRHSLHRAVAAPDEEQLGAFAEHAFYLLRREAALRHFDPERVVDALPRRARARSSGRPSPNDLPACAMTATFVIRPPGSRPGTPRG